MVGLGHSGDDVVKIADLRGKAACEVGNRAHCALRAVDRVPDDARAVAEVGVDANRVAAAHSRRDEFEHDAVGGCRESGRPANRDQRIRRENKGIVVHAVERRDG